jgi:hypothetical protein
VWAYTVRQILFETCQRRVDIIACKQNPLLSLSIILTTNPGFDQYNIRIVRLRLQVPDLVDKNRILIIGPDFILQLAGYLAGEHSAGWYFKIPHDLQDCAPGFCQIFKSFIGFGFGGFGFAVIGDNGV